MVEKITLSVSLAERPSQNYHQWFKHICTVAASLCAHLYPHGLLFLVLPQATYMTFPDVGDQYPVPAQPERPVGAATATNLAIYKETYENWQQFRLNMQALRAAIIESLGDAIRRSQLDLATGIILHNTNTIMANIKAAYGIITSADLTQIRAELAKPLLGSDHTTFTAHGAEFTENVAIVARSGQPLAYWDQENIFLETCSGFVAVNDSNQRYIQANPVLTNRTLAALITHTTQQLVNIPVGATGYANAATVAAIDPNHPAFKAAVAAAVAAHMGQQRPAGSAARRQAPGGAAPAQSRPRMYCYHHGYLGHKGSKCKHMLADRTAFTQAMLDADFPGRVPGGHT